jgi:hypothetical protein
LPSLPAAEGTTASWRLHAIDPCGRERGADGTDTADLNGDGRPDIVCPWEQAKQVRVYLSRQGGAEWDAVQVTPGRSAGAVEDAAFGDLDGDGKIDVVAASESKKIVIAWAPEDRGDLGRGESWKQGSLPAAESIQTAWMNVEVVDIDRDGRPDILAAAKTRNAGVYWFRSAGDPRDLAAWRGHVIDPEISWAMSVIPCDLDADGDLDVILTDRPSVVCWYEHPGREKLHQGPWKRHVIAGEGGPYLWGHLHDLDGDGRRDILVATFAPQAPAGDRKVVINWWRAPGDPRRVADWEHHAIQVDASRVRSSRHKALNVADLDGDGREEIALSTEAPGDVYLLRHEKSVLDSVWSVENLVGREKGKYDTVDFLDLDGDGDLDILTSEEFELGVFWLENPRLTASLETSGDSPPGPLLDIFVRDRTGLKTRRPVSGGVPLPRGAAPEESRFRLLADGDVSVPLQSAVLARWKDGSARWVLLDFQAAPPANGTARFRLLGAGESASPRPSDPVRVLSRETPCLETGRLRIAPAKDALLNISDRLDVRLVLTDGAGGRCPGVVESARVEREGPLRSVLALAGSFRTAEGKRVFGFQLRAAVFAGLPTVFLEPLILVDPAEGVIQKIRALELEVAPRGGIRSAAIGARPGWKGKLSSKVRLLQIDDRSYRLEGVEGKGSRAPGWAELEDGEGTVAVALRDFREQWPKSIEVDAGDLAIGLFPAFEEGTFAHMQPWYKHQYLFEGDCYRLRTGQARRWQVWLDLSGDGSSLAKAAGAPLVPAADPAAAIATGVWGPIAAAGTRGMEEYDRWAENLFDKGYCRSIAEQRDYGAMNWGDWWGERGCNWGNHEYDTARHILVQFARTGDPKYLYTGDTAARHTSEVDVVHFLNRDLRNHFEKDLGGRSDYPARPGMVHQHCVGHVSGFYSVEKIRELYVSLGIGKSQRPYLCLDPYNLGHVWTRGMVCDYFLTGDPWMKATVEKIGENLAQLVEDRKFRFKGHSHCGRVNGWTMLALAGAYELDFDERYLRAMKLLADDALSEQNPETGGWHYRLPWGHCYCEKKHVGEAAFIGAIRLNGLSRYYELTGDPRIPEAVRRGVTHLNRDTWEEKYNGWRYTSCPRSASGPGRQTGVIVLALVNSVKLGGDAEQMRILRKAWHAKFEALRTAPASRPGLGKAYSTIMLGCPEAMRLFVAGSAAERE